MTNLKLNTNQTIIPTSGKLISTWAKEIINKINTKDQLFYRINSNEVVEIGTIKIDGQEKGKPKEYQSTGILQVTPNRFITLIEEYLIPGTIIKNKDNNQLEFKEKSISAQLANTVLVSNTIREGLPQLQRIFTVPIPIKHNNTITFPKKGYDPRFKSWQNYDSPTITQPNMTLKEAKEILNEIYKEFCFKDKEQNNTHHDMAIAALLTPFLRGLYPTFSTRTPIFFYIANRERSGKDFCAGITGILYEGQNIEDSAISTSEKFGNNSEELRKKIMAALIQGRTRLHFSNNKGHIDNAVLEGVTTMEQFSDRVLGQNKNLSFDNEIDFSLSGNTGVTYTADFANRCRFINLFLAQEDANSRVFEKAELHHWIRENRETILSALYALVRNWEEQGCPPGKIPFASFSSWSKICGGIMEAAGYENPCAIIKKDEYAIGDVETNDMKTLFEIACKTYGQEKIEKPAILKIVDENDLFTWFDLTKKGDQIKLGMLLLKYVGRILSDITMIDTTPTERPSRKKYNFIKNYKWGGEQL